MKQLSVEEQETDDGDSQHDPVIQNVEYGQEGREGTKQRAPEERFSGPPLERQTGSAWGSGECKHCCRGEWQGSSEWVKGSRDREEAACRYAKRLYREEVLRVSPGWPRRLQVCRRCLEHHDPGHTLLFADHIQTSGIARGRRSGEPQPSGIMR